MSLDVSLYGLETSTKNPAIYARENGSTFEISREDWDTRNPGIEPVASEHMETFELYSANITHNLGRMADAAGLYKALWRPEEINIDHAEGLIPVLEKGLEALESDPDKYMGFNPENGWGSYDGLVSFTSEYLKACKAHPKAEVSVCR